MRTLQQLAEKDQPEILRDQALSGLLTIEAGKDEDWSVNRLLKMHEAAQLELQDLEADFQFRLQESILLAEVKLKQRFDEQVQRLQVKLEDVTREKARLEEELRKAYACRNAGDPRLEKLRRADTLPRIWEL